MQEHQLNCQGLPCPQPVIRIKKLLEDASPDVISVIVDNEPALENISRFLNSHGYALTHAREGDVWRVRACKKDEGCDIMPEEALREQAPAGKTAHPNAEDAKTLVMIISPVFGSGDDALGTKLMKNFIATLQEMGPSLWRIVLLNGGVSLSVRDSAVLHELRELEKNGVSILVCGTCLDYFALLDQKAVGETTNMLDVVTSMQLADKVIRI